MKLLCFQFLKSLFILPEAISIWTEIALCAGVSHLCELFGRYLFALYWQKPFHQTPLLCAAFSAALSARHLANIGRPS